MLHLGSSHMLRAAPLPRERISTRERAGIEFIRALVADAFAHARDAHAVKTRQVTPLVRCGVTKSRDVGRLARASWHTRSSEHCVPYELMRDGLCANHSQHEQEYIHALERAECLEELAPGVGIWHLAYKLPPPTSDRDFCELVACVELPPHAHPFSAAHEEATLAQPDILAKPRAPQGDERRSFLVISQPVEHAASPRHVRAYYASVEAVSEAQGSQRWVCVAADQHDRADRLGGLGAAVCAGARDAAADCG